jgi:hypothetical protein
VHAIATDRYFPRSISNDIAATCEVVCANARALGTQDAAALRSSGAMGMRTADSVHHRPATRPAWGGDPHMAAKKKAAKKKGTKKKAAKKKK